MSGAFGCGTANSLDRGKEVLPFFAVRVSLDLLGLTGRPNVLHLAQLLLHKLTTVVEGYSDVVGRVIEIDFVLSILYGEQVLDGGVVVVEPVLLWRPGRLSNLLRNNSLTLACSSCSSSFSFSFSFSSSSSSSSYFQSPVVVLLLPPSPYSSPAIFFTSRT
nr:unnamed protein product [Spirometra erinaceieuropaei]